MPKTLKKRPLIDRICIRVEHNNRWQSLTLREAIDMGHGNEAMAWVLQRLEVYKVNHKIIEDLVKVLPSDAYVALRQ